MFFYQEDISLPNSNILKLSIRPLNRLIVGIPIRSREITHANIAIPE